MSKFTVKYLCLIGILFVFWSCATAPATKPSTNVPQKLPKGIDPAQTSDDPTFGYRKENAVKLGPGAEFAHLPLLGPKMSKHYLRHLRDKAFKPFKFKRLYNVGPGEDGHIIDLYELIDSDGKKHKIYIDMYHPGSIPSKSKAPKGMFTFW